MRNAFVDGELDEELTGENMEFLEEAVKLAKEQLPNFAAKIAPEVERIKMAYGN